MSTATKEYPVTRSEAEWRKLLSAEQYAVMRQHGTERPGSCALNYEKRAGTFECAGCGQPLFKSQGKFESGTGWPSFNEPEPGATETTEDNTFGMQRTAVHCSRCGSHLGHVFPDGVVHAARNTGSEPASELATYVLEKGKPLVVLAE